MVKKIGVFIMILGLFFVGTPQVNVKSRSYDNVANVIYSFNQNLAQVDYDNGYVDGYDNGYYDGYNEGKQDGYSDGLLDGEGFGLGYDAGYENGETYGFNSGFNEGYRQGYDLAYDFGFEAGTNLDTQQAYDDGVEAGIIQAWNDAYDKGKTYGYNKGLNETDATGFIALLGTVFGGLGTLLSIELLPGIYIGAIIAVPLVFGIIFFILGKRKGD